MSTLLWFRQDLRLEDNPALAGAIARGEPVIPVYLWAAGEEAEWAPGGASRWWLHHALVDLEAQLSERGSRLLVREVGCAGSLVAVQELVSEAGASTLR